MAKIRTIKPELFRHEDLFEAELESSMPLRLVFAGLFTCCDREGRFRWKPRQLKLDILPYDNIDFAPLLEVLHAKGFIAKYEREGEYFGYIPSWHKHQTINTREPKSRLPDPDKGSLITPKVIAAQSSLESHSQSVSSLSLCSIIGMCKHLQRNSQTASECTQVESENSCPAHEQQIIPAIYKPHSVYSFSQGIFFELPGIFFSGYSTIANDYFINNQSNTHHNKDKNLNYQQAAFTENKFSQHKTFSCQHLHVHAHAAHMRAHLEVELEGKWKGNGSGSAKRSAAHADMCMQSNLSQDVNSICSQLTALSETFNSENHSDAKQNSLTDIEKPLLTIPLKNNTEFPIEQSQLDEWKSLYPRIDVLQTLRHIRGWNLANPSKRKTLMGINKHITAWLSKEETNTSLNRHSRYPPHSFSAYSGSRVQALHDHNLAVAEQWLNQSEEIIINGETLYDTR